MRIKSWLGRVLVVKTLNNTLILQCCRILGHVLITRRQLGLKHPILRERTLWDTSYDADFIDLNAACERQNYSCTVNSGWQCYSRISVILLSRALHKAPFVYRKLEKVKLMKVVADMNSYNDITNDRLTTCLTAAFTSCQAATQRNVKTIHQYLSISPQEQQFHSRIMYQFQQSSLHSFWNTYLHIFIPCIWNLHYGEIYTQLDRGLKVTTAFTKTRAQSNTTILNSSSGW